MKINKLICILIILVLVLSLSIMVFACDKEDSVDEPTTDTDDYVTAEELKTYGFEVKPSTTTTAIISDYTGKLTKFSISGRVMIDSKTYDITEMEAGLFKDDTRLKEISLPEKLTYIPDELFSGCTNLEEVTIPSSIESIGNNAFKNCSSYKLISIPKTVKKIGRQAFYGCTSLEFAAFPEKMDEIGSYAFYSCNKLWYISIPQGITKIDESTFAGCSNLTAITIPSSVTEICAYAFDSDTSLIAVTIPSTVVKIGARAFYNCSLENFSFEKRTDDIDIAVEAFMYCKFETVELPDSMTYIKPKVFYGCLKLSNLIIPTSLTDYSFDAFQECTALKDMTYKGTLDQWSQVSSHGNVVYPSGCKIHCTDGDTTI